MTTTKTKASYSEANANIRRENSAGEAGGTATTQYCKFRSFQKLRLKTAHAYATTAGTAAGHGFDVYSGTTSVGTIALGTSAAETHADAGSLNLAVAAGAQLSVKSLSDAVGKAHIVFEYEVDHDALVTA